MPDHSDERSSALPLIVAVLAAITIGYWLFHGSSTSDQKPDAQPPAAQR